MDYKKVARGGDREEEQIAKWRRQRIWRLAKWHYSFPFAEDLPGLSREEFAKTINFFEKKINF